MAPPKLLGTIPWIACKDIAATIRYFETALGFRTEWTWGDPPTDAGVIRDNAKIYLFTPGELATRVTGSEITIVVEDVDALYAEHQSRGANITEPIDNEPWGSREYHVTEPNGYILRFSGEP
jgi:uncharacterized glyoxalase superfamily protein PhnB